jgi:sulfur carrier protein
MRLDLNGTPSELTDGSTITDAIEAAGASPDGRGLAVAVDGEVVPRPEWERTTLREGQRIEIVTAVQGG